MIRGKVSGDQQALVVIDIMDDKGQPRSLEVVLGHRVYWLSDIASGIHPSTGAVLRRSTDL